MRRSNVSKALGPALLLALALLAVPAAAHADTSDFTFDSFDVDYTLTRLDDGTAHLEVVETIVAVFPDFDQNKGIIRAIPDDYDGVDLRTSVRSVVDENGADVPFELDARGGFIELALGTEEYVHGRTTYVISYSQDNVVRSFADTGSDEFYWDLNGTGWQQPFGRVAGVLHVDPSLASALTGNCACYTGPVSATDTCPIATPSATEFAVSVDNLGAGENVTIAVGFAKGTFVAPVPTRGVAQPIPLGIDLLSGGIGVLGVGGMIAAIVARVRAGRGARGRGTIIPQYSEPEGITILQAAHLEKRPWTAMPAALVRLAVRKNIRILAYSVEGGSEPYTLQYLGSERTNAEDQAILLILFGENPAAGATSPFGDSQQPEARALYDLSTRAGGSLVSQGYQARARGAGTGILLVVAQVVLGIAALGTLALSLGAYSNVSAFLGPTVLIGSIGFIVTIAMARRPLHFTAKGVEAHEYLLGMQMYLTLAEKDRLRALQSPQGAERVDVGNNQEMIRLYEKLLPWAVLWGVEDQWMKELALRVETEPTQPDWFVSTSGFNASMFSSTMLGLRSTISAPVVSSGGSSWSSSGSGFGSTFSGGSMGGGFSGGGGGGGGGGGR